MSTPEPVDDFDAPPSRAKYYWTAAILLALIALIGFFFGRDSYRTVKSWRAQQLAHQAEQYANEQKWREALQSAQAAYQLASTDPKTLRILARLQSRMSPPDAFDLYMKLAELPSVRADDIRELARLAIALNKLHEAQKAVELLLANNPSSVENLLLASDLSLAKHDFSAAVVYATRARATDPNNRLAKFALARLLVRDPKSHAEAAKILLNLGIPSADQIGLDALQMLAQMTDITEEEARLDADALARHPLSKLPQQLLALQVEMRLRPNDRSTILDEAIKKYTNTEDNRLVVARWLNQQKEYQRTIDTVPDSVFFLTQNHFLVRLDAMAALGQWKEIDKILTNPKVPLEAPLRDLYRARCSRELGLKEESEARWNSAIAEAARDPNPNTLWYLADYALRLNERAQAWKIFQRLTQNPVTARRAYENLVRMAEQEADSPRLLNVIQEAAKSYPADPAPRNDIAYLQLLLGRDKETATATAESLLQSQPNMMSFRVTLALARLKEKQPKQAMELFDAVTFPPRELLPGWQAVYAATLAANNRTTDAKAIAAQIPLTRLKPEERELIRGLR